MSPSPEILAPATRWWHRRSGGYSLGEKVLDGIVHAVGIATAAGLGSALVVLAAGMTAPVEWPLLLLYVVSLLSMLGVSMVFNLTPPSAAKRLLARIDQAAIFLFVAASYTPFLALISGTSLGALMMVLVWSAALVGVVLKLLIPDRFGRIAIPLYLLIGWSGVAAFQALAAELSPASVWLLLAGGVIYSAGIIFHLWERLKYHNVVWHLFVVVAATLHLIAVLDVMVVSRTV